MEGQQAKELAWHMSGNAEEIANILAEFAEEVRRGDLVLWKQQKELHLDARGKIQLSVKGSDTAGQDTLQINMNWSS